MEKGTVWTHFCFDFWTVSLKGQQDDEVAETRMSLSNVGRVAAQPEHSLCKVDCVCLDRQPEQLQDSGPSSGFTNAFAVGHRFLLPWFIVIQGTSMFSGLFSISFAVS